MCSMRHAGAADATPMQPRSLGRMVLGRVANAALRWIARARERRALAALDQRLLADIGIDRRSAAIEANKPPWRP